MTKKLNKKGTSLVELIAVIVIMGIIAGIAVPTTIAVINRQRKNAAASSASTVFDAAKTLLVEAGANGQIPGVTVSGNTYTATAASMLASGDIDKNPFVYADTDATGGMTITYTVAGGEGDTTNGSFTVTITGTINGYNISYANGKFTASSN